MLNLKGTIAENRSLTENFESRNYTLNTFEINPKISYLLNSNTRFDLFYQYLNKENKLNNFELLIKQKIGVSFNYANAQKIAVNGEFNYIGGIAIGGGTLQGFGNLVLNSSSIDEITKKATFGDRKNIDLLIGDVVNDIGVLNPSVTASNFAKLKKKDDVSENDIAAALLNMIGEVIGTIAYLNASLCGINKVHFIGRVSTNKYIKNAINERLKLADMRGIFEDNREYGTVVGALKLITTN